MEINDHGKSQQTHDILLVQDFRSLVVDCLTKLNIFLLRYFSSRVMSGPFHALKTPLAFFNHSVAIWVYVKCDGLFSKRAVKQIVWWYNKTDWQ